MLDLNIARLRDVHDGYRKILDATKIALQTVDPTVPISGQYVAVKARADKALDEISRRATEASKACREAVEAIEGDIVKHLELNVEAKDGGEIRAHFRNLPDNERNQAIHDAIERGDKATMQAILGSKFFLSGLTADELEKFRKLHIEKNAAAMVARRKTLTLALDINRQALLDLLDGMVKLFPPERVKEITAQRGRAAAARDEITPWLNAG